MTRCEVIGFNGLCCSVHVPLCVTVCTSLAVSGISIPLNLLTLIVLLSGDDRASGDIQLLAAIAFWDLGNNIFWAMSSMGLLGMNSLLHAMESCIIRAYFWDVCRLEAWLSYTTVAVWRLATASMRLPDVHLPRITIPVILLCNLIASLLIDIPQLVICYIDSDNDGIERMILENSETLIFAVIMILSYFLMARKYRSQARAPSDNYNITGMEIMLFSICVSFLLLNLPYAVVVTDKINNSPYFIMIAYVLHECSFVANTVVYLIAWPAFRLRCKNILCGRSNHRYDDQSVGERKCI